MRSLSILFVFSLVQRISASLYNKHEALGIACALAAQDLFTTCNQEDYDCFCASNTYIYAVQKCIGNETDYNSKLMGMAFDAFDVSFCRAHNSHANTTDVWSAENQKLNPTVTQKAYQRAYEGERNNLAQKRISVCLGISLVFYWVAILLVAFLVRAIRKAWARLFAYRIVMRRRSPLERLFQRHLSWPALFQLRHMSRHEYFNGYITFSLPTRVESVAVSGYILLALIFMLTPYTFMNNDPIYPSRWKEMMRYASDRAGIMATVQFPMLILFAMRNNILQWLCGWSYSKFNTYHRAVSRVTYTLLIVHAVTKHIFSASYGGSLVKYYYPVPYFRWGCAAIGLFSLMIFFAMFRSRCYELFYRLHQAMALGGIICSIFHLKRIGFKAPLWISIAIWSADWLIRAGRILLFNVNFIFPPLPGAHRSSYATARVYDGQMIKLTVTTPVRWVCEPGQFVFLHSNKWTFIGGHPFSVLGSSPHGEGLEILIKARDGMTKRLFNTLDDRSCSPKYPITIPVYVEGPYGQSIAVELYEEGLFFAGGIGITGVLSYIDKMAQSNKTSDIPKKIRLFWAIRSLNDISPVSDTLMRLSKMEGVEITIYRRQALARGGADGSEPGSARSVYKTRQIESVLALHPVAGISPSSRSFSDSSSSRKQNTNYMQRVPPTFPRDSQTYAKTGGRQNPEDDMCKISISEPSQPRHPNQSRDSRYKHQLKESMPHRSHTSKLIDAGFMDAFSERRISSLNPFDETRYFYNGRRDDDTLDSIEEKAASQKNEIYNMVEPVGMDVVSLVKHYFSTSEGSICVLGCGPDSMMDTLRWSCSTFLELATTSRVDYYEEAFRW